MWGRISWGAVVLAASFTALSGCANSPNAGNSSAPGRGATTAASGGSTARIEGAGATFPAPIYTKWFAGYQSQSGTAVNYQAVGSGAGYKALHDKTVDFAASDAPLTTAEESALSGPVVHIPTVGGAVVLAYHLSGVPNGLHLTSDIIGDIYLGKIKTWNDPRIVAINAGVKLSATPITSVHRTDGSGTTYIFTHYLEKVSPAWKDAVGAGKSVNWPNGLGGKGNDGVASSVRRTEGAIGYVELAYAIANKLNFAQVKNHDGQFVTASVDSTAAALTQYVGELSKDIKTPTVDAPGATSYPICSMTYILMYKNGGRNTAGAVKLWQWAMQPAQQQEAATLYYAPLPAEVVKLNQTALQSVTGAGK
jgi:phosphate transport system substrate-binding protein